MSLQFKQVVSIEQLEPGMRFQVLNSKARTVFTYSRNTSVSKQYKHEGKADNEPYPRPFPSGTQVIFLRDADPLTK